MKLRKSHLVSYRACPRQYWYRWILKRKVDEVSPVAQVGLVFHHFANKFFDCVDYDKLTKLSTHQDIDNYFFSLIPDDILPSVYQYCRNFCDFEARHYLALRQRYSAQRTKFFWFPLEREKELESKTLKGHLDRLDLLTNGKLSTGEYKVSTSWNKTRLRFELAFYCALVNAIPKYQKRAQYIWSYNPLLNAYFFETVNKRTFQAIMRWINRLKASHAQKVYPRNVSTICSYCPFAHECLSEIDEEIGGLISA